MEPKAICRPPRLPLLLLLLLLSTTLLHLAAGLQFSREPEDMLVEQGKPARLDCEARLDSQPGGLLQELPAITWRTDDEQPINFIGDRYRSQLANGSLYISSVNQESAGSYQCLASIESIGAIASRTAVVKIASLPGFDREPQDTMVYPSQIAYLSCKLATTDQVNIQWLKDEQPLVLDESRMTILPSGALEIDEVLPQDIGSYRCNASGYGQYRLSNKAQLTLQTSDIDEGESAPVFVAKPFNQVAIEKSTITLECAANGNPKPDVYWLKDGSSIDLASLDSRYQTVAASSLMIKDVTEEDNGSYQCRAKNDVDTLDAVAEVVVQVPPRFIKRPLDKEASERQDLEFECEIYGKPPPTITWLKNGERIKLSNYWQLTNGYNLRINGLLNIDAGIFQCMGTNPAGSVQASARLTIHQPKKERKGAGRKSALRQGVGPNGKPVAKKKLPHWPLSNSTWQHPSTLLGHTLSAYTQNPALSISPSDDPADLLNGPFAQLPAATNFSYDPPDDSVVSDNLDGSDFGEAATPPSAPRNLSVGLLNSRFVVLRWQEPEIATGEVYNYLIYYKQEGFERERIERTPHKETTVKISGLQPGTTYQFRAVANISDVYSASSKILQLTTESEPNVPSQPLNLRGWPTSSESIALTWEEPNVINGRITSYLITYAEGDNEEMKRNTTNTAYELFGLMPYKEYNIWVQAVNDNGPGASTGEIRVRTFSAAPTSPPNVTVEAASSTSVIIRWEPPAEGQNGIITGYKIRYRPTDRRSHPNVVTTDGDQRMHVLNRLEKNVSYQVRVCAFNVNGTGPYSEWQDIETYENDLSESEVPSAPTNLNTKAMDDSILVWWGPPKDQTIKVRGYVLTWGKGVPDEYKKVLDGKQRSYTIENLKPNSDYVITLRAKNEAGEGLQVYENVKTIERSTPESAAPLTPPVGLKAIVMSHSTVVLYWTDMTLSKNQYITDNRHYVVRYTQYHRSSNPRYKYYNATDLNCMIQDLKPNTEYEFTVKVVKGRRESPWSMVVLNKTMEVKPASSPRDLTVQSIDDYPRSVLLRWLPPKQSNGDINGYIISYTTDNTKNDRDWKAEAVVGDKTEYVLSTELQPSTTYFFKIQARNTKGYGPFSTTISYKTPENNRGLSNMLIYIIVGCSILFLTGVTVVIVFVCCRSNPNSPDGKKGYLKDTNIKTNIKPPDLWIHHDQMELKALEKNIGNGEASTSATTSNTLPRSGNSDYNQDSSIHGNSSSLDKRTYIPSYMGNEEKCSTLSRQHSRGSHKPKLITLPVDSAPLHQPIATATPIVNSSMSQQTIHSSCSDVPSIRQNYPRTAAQYSLSRAHITLEPTPESSPDSYNLSNSYEPLQTQLYSSGGPQSYNATSQYNSSGYGEGSQSANSCTSNSENSAKRLQGHPLKSFSVPAPPPQSAPSTPQQKHGVSQVTVRPTISGSPYKKATGSSQLIKNRLASVTSTNHTPEEIERLKPSYSTEELNQEMANLEGLMKDLNAITASEFEC